MAKTEIQRLEMELFELTKKLNVLRAENPVEEISDYDFTTLNGRTTLKELFAGKKQLMVIHNMGQGCRYCTLWGDGINPFLSHLESAMSVVMVSKDSPEVQRIFSNSRNWRFRMASHSGGKYINEQSVSEGEDNYPGVALYELKGDKIFRKNFTSFGPYDQFCSAWNLLSLAGKTEDNWTPQYNYWKMPGKLDDGGSNVL